MKKNEFESIEQFTSQYTGEWNPSEGHWYGLDFKYNGREYRFDTGNMYEEKLVLPDGKEVLFTLYKKKDRIDSDGKEYELIGGYSDMEEVLKEAIIENRYFREIIVDADTELLGQD